MSDWSMVRISSILPCGRGNIQRNAIKDQHVIRCNGGWWTSTLACHGQAINPVVISKMTWHRCNSDGCYPIVDSLRSMVIVKCTTAPYQARLDTVRAFKDRHGSTISQQWALTGHYWFNLPAFSQGRGGGQTVTFLEFFQCSADNFF